MCNQYLLLVFVIIIIINIFFLKIDSQHFLNQYSIDKIHHNMIVFAIGGIFLNLLYYTTVS